MNEKAIMLCLRCGYVNERRPPGSVYTRRDEAHRRRCDYVMAIRYLDLSTGRITGGAGSGAGYVLGLSWNRG